VTVADHASGEAPGELAEGVLVVGSGLIGTSVGLALRARGVPVHLLDADPARAALAADLGAGSSGAPESEPALVVVAVPASQVAMVVEGLSRTYLYASFTDVASIKSQVQVDIEATPGLSGRFVGGHPMAGRERSGAAVARGDLFEGRPWVLTPTSETDPVVMSRARALVAACGGDLVMADAGRHDEAVALVSHAPQVVASLMAARLVDADADLVALAGQGVRDVTRIAASDAALWTDILAGNAGLVGPVLDRLAADLDAVRSALTELAADSSRSTDESPGRDIGESTNRDNDRNSAAVSVLTEALERGARGRARLPGKHGGRPTTYATVQVVVSDEPGELARLFTAADHAGVNVEDVTIEHAAGHPVGVVELMVQPSAAVRLADALRSARWVVHG
jgi:prephenate dehydrogenase